MSITNQHKGNSKEKYPILNFSNKDTASGRVGVPKIVFVKNSYMNTRIFLLKDTIHIKDIDNFFEVVQNLASP